MMSIDPDLLDDDFSSVVDKIPSFIPVTERFNPIA
jgi:hypothetical protein